MHMDINADYRRGRGGKKMCKKKLFGLVLFCVLCGHFASSAFSEETGAAFLKIGFGARAIAMGGGYVAIADDLNAIYWNPGGLAQLKQKEFTAMHTEWLESLKHEFVGYAFPTKVGTLAFGLGYLGMDKIEKRGDSGELLEETFTAYDSVGTFSYSRVINPKTSAGINLKIIHQRIENETANGLAIDLGTLYRFSPLPLTAGFTLQNLGPKMKFIREGYNLPLTISAGLAYRVFANALTLGMGITHRVFEQKTDFGFGSEYWVGNIFALRGKYNLLSSNNQLTANRSTEIPRFGAGLGFRLLAYQFDYAFTPYSELGETHRISFTAKF